MQIYLPIAEIPVNIILVLALGLLTGFLAGMFGIGGGFLATPFLIFIGIPPAVAVSTSTNQIISASISGLLAHIRKGNVDIKMGGYLVFGGFIGSSAGVLVFKMLQKKGHIDVTIAVVYVIFLGLISFAMLRDSMRVFFQEKYGFNAENKQGKVINAILKIIDKMPYRLYFPKSGVIISPIVPIILSCGIGILVALMGIGGGFLMIPAMVYLLRMPSSVVVGTSLFQIVFIASNATFLQAISNNNVDIVLASLMIFSSAIGAQIGTRTGYKVNANGMRAILATMLLGICIKMLFVLFSEPKNLFIVEILK